MTCCLPSVSSTTTKGVIPRDNAAHLKTVHQEHGDRHLVPFGSKKKKMSCKFAFVCIIVRSFSVWSAACMRRFFWSDELIVRRAMPAISIPAAVREFLSKAVRPAQNSALFPIPSNEWPDSAAAMSAAAWRTAGSGLHLRHGLLHGGRPSSTPKNSLYPMACHAVAEGGGRFAAGRAPPPPARIEPLRPPGGQ